MGSFCAVTPLVGGLLEFMQVGLRFNEVCLGYGPGLFWLQLGAPGPSVFLELPRLRDKAVGNTDNLTFIYWFARRGCVIDALV